MGESLITILYKRKLIDSRKKAYLFTPYKVIEGNVSDTTGYFVEEKTGNSYMLVSHINAVYSDAKIYAGAPQTKADLQEKLHIKTTDDLKLEYFKLWDESVNIGIYDQVTEKINIFQLYPASEYEYAFDDEEVSYESLRDDVKADFTVISMDELNSLLSLKDIESIIDKLTSIKNDKNDCVKKLGNKDGKRFILLDSHIDLITQLENPRVIKQILLDICKRDLLKSKSEKKEEVVNPDVIFKAYILEMTEFAECKTIEEFHTKLATAERLIEKEKEDAKKYKSNKYLAFVLDYSSFLKDLEKIDSMEKVKTAIWDFYRETEEALKEATYELQQEQQNETAQVKKQEESKEKYEISYIEKQKELEQVFSKDPEHSYMFDYNKVHDQIISRIIGRGTQIDAILTTIKRNDNVSNPSKRSAVIIAGTTGTGKTQTFTELKNALSSTRPVVLADTNQLTEQGYVGGTIEDNILAPLIQEAHAINVRNGIGKEDVITESDIKLAQHGIIILDEIDKRAETDGKSNVNKSGVVHQLLKLMDPGTQYQVKIGKTYVTFDTSYLTIFASGAFQEYFDELEEKKNKPKVSLGFTSTKDIEETIDNFSKYNEVDPKELTKYGLDRQFVGRYNKAILFPTHNIESLKELELNKATSNINVELEELKSSGIDLVWDDEFIDKLALEAHKLGMGGRGLSNILARVLGNLSVEVNNRPGKFKTVYLPITSFESSSNIILVTVDGEIVTLGELYKETEEKNLRLKRLQDISMNKNALLEAKALLNKIEEDKQKTIGTMN